MSTVIGYAYGQNPTYTAADIDYAYEAESARLWEELNTNDNEKKYLAAAESIKKAIEHLEKVVNHINQGAQDAEGLPLENKLYFFANDFEDRIYDLKRMMEKASRGEEL